MLSIFRDYRAIAQIMANGKIPEIEVKDLSGTPFKLTQHMMKNIYTEDWKKYMDKKCNDITGSLDEIIEVIEDIRYNIQKTVDDEFNKIEDKLFSVMLDVTP